ncbi:hypothetical protein PLESTB_001344700 [Pleodorina starrii]|uniref:B30.2/SPRY domain-containing protein n=1 Tax=Pleodorina starrii TaxID=330485 RepID=A0A9W6BUI6_9CHLO|nr:hypothetical protein PLESTM_001921300 [Pleodorina starrii]GLC58308.1 hypothetical protein PLESTB_001344700 [Pleodorina starrii]GLC66470.1 hypothetical protein PLESTF_000431100 [Pleodorina starrii]
MQTFVNRTGASGLKLSSQGKSFQITVTRELPGPCTISTREPVRGPGKHAFEVAMPKKGVRTALGFLEQPRSEYMTPDYLTGGGYVSYGGAGFIYPAKAMSRATYTEGDTVRCELCFDSKRVTFWVNGSQAGSAPWRGPSQAYPAVSVFPGDLVCNIAFE